MNRLPEDLRLKIEGNPVAKALYEALPDDIKGMVTETEEEIVARMRTDYSARSHDELVQLAIETTKDAGMLRADLIFAEEKLQALARETRAGDWFWACYLSTQPDKEVRVTQAQMEAFDSGYDLLVETHSLSNTMRARLVQHGDQPL